jgi:3-mercaptopyruvate sulfurtransferase SseA
MRERLMRRDRTISVTIPLFMLFLASVLYSCAGPARVKEVNASTLKRLIDKGSVTVIDTRTAFEYRQGHIPGAVHLPEERFPLIEGGLPADRHAALVFYCRGYG